MLKASVDIIITLINIINVNEWKSTVERERVYMVWVVSLVVDNTPCSCLRGHTVDDQVWTTPSLAPPPPQVVTHGIPGCQVYTTDHTQRETTHTYKYDVTGWNPNPHSVASIHDTCSQLTWKSHSPHTHRGTCWPTLTLTSQTTIPFTMNYYCDMQHHCRLSDSVVLNSDVRNNNFNLVRFQFGFWKKNSRFGSEWVWYSSV